MIKVRKVVIDMSGYKSTCFRASKNSLKNKIWTASESTINEIEKQNDFLKSIIKSK